MHDYSGGILPSGLFWTLALPKSSVDFSSDNRRATLKVRDLPVVDTFRFLGPTEVPAVVDFRVTWEATGPFASYGKGTTVPPTDRAAFLGEFAPAVANATMSGEQMGFSFESLPGVSSAPNAYAQIGTERNGVFLS